MSEIIVTEHSLEPLPPDQEIANLRQLLADKDHAVLRAKVAASEAQQELESLKTENAVLKADAESTRQELEATQISKLRAQWKATEKNLEKQRDNVRAELIGVRTRWQQTQQDLQRETRARRTDAMKAASEIATLQRDLTDAREIAPAKKSGALRKSAAAMAATAAIALAGYAGWRYWPEQKASPYVAASSVNTPAGWTKSPVVPASTARPQGFQGALSSLNDALASYPGAAPESILKAVRRQNPNACDFQWNNGQPAFVFRGKEPMSTALNRCAKAVEALGNSQ